MGSLTTCLQAAGDILPPELKDAILAKAAELRQSGMKAAEADRKAVQEMLADNDGSLAEVEGAIKEGRVLYGEQEQQAASAVDRIAIEQPDLQVKLPGSDKTMSVAEALEAARAEADEIASVSDLVKVAVECALSFG